MTATAWPVIPPACIRISCLYIIMRFSFLFRFTSVSPRHMAWQQDGGMNKSKILSKQRRIYCFLVLALLLHSIPSLNWLFSRVQLLLWSPKNDFLRLSLSVIRPLLPFPSTASRSFLPPLSRKTVWFRFILVHVGNGFLLITVGMNSTAFCLGWYST